MKKKLLLAIICLLTITSYAQDLTTRDVPQPVMNAFKQVFPKATGAEWELKGDVYNVSFEINGTDHEACIDPTGKIVRQKQDIKSADLPPEVLAAINKEFSGYRIDDTEKFETGNDITYKADLKSATEKWEVVFDSQGKVRTKKPD